ncbi:MAG: efflux RND transporter periplasmic adaptor subunit [Alphaproteobacteria bacterium]|nr:MAG: efflux RND transporter periplasmic adaptor subunit [Alphaproteobacteria bacterium]
MVGKFNLWSLRKIAMVGLTGIALSLTACDDGETEVSEPTVRPVKTIVVGGDSGGTIREFPGTVRASHRVDLAFQVSGLLIKLNVIEGQKVSTGDIIAQIDPRDLRSIRDGAKARFQQADGDFKRDETLHAQGHVAKARLDKTSAARDIAASQLEQTEKALRDTNLRAPFTGTIAKRYVDNFQDVRSKQAIVSLQDVTELELVIDLPESIIAQRGAGNRPPAKIFGVFESAPDQRLPLTIKETAAEADPITRTYKVTAVFPAPEGILVLPGMTATVIAELPSGDIETLSVPTSAIFGEPSGGEGAFVWLVDQATNQVSRRAIEVGQMTGNNAIIQSGLSIGDRVVTAGVHYLAEGQKVRIVDLGGGG